MEIIVYINGKKTEDKCDFNTHGYFIYKNSRGLCNLNFYGIEEGKPLKTLLGYSDDTKLGLKGFTKAAKETYGACLINVRNTTGYIEISKVFNLGHVYLFKYKDEWYISRQGSILIVEKNLGGYSKVVFDNENVAVSTKYARYTILNEEKHTMYLRDYTVIENAKLVRLYRTNAANQVQTLDGVRNYFEVGNYYVDAETQQTMYHKSLDGTTPFSFTQMFTKDELRAIKSGTQYDTFRNKMLKICRSPIIDTYSYRIGDSEGIKKCGDKVALLQNWGQHCMDYVKQPYTKRYYVSQASTEIYGYTKEDVFKWYNYILELFKGYYTKEDMCLDLVEVSKDYTSLAKFDGTNVHYWQVVLTDKVKAYHKYLFAILFRYIYSPWTYAFPIAIMDLIEKDKVDIWTALKTVLNKFKKEWDWEIVGDESIPKDFPLDKYLEEVSKYNKESLRFTQILTKHYT